MYIVHVRYTRVDGSLAVKLTRNVARPEMREEVDRCTPPYSSTMSPSISTDNVGHMYIIMYYIGKELGCNVISKQC